MHRNAKIEPKPSASGGWGSVNSVAHILRQEQVPLLGSKVLWKQNRPDGFMCVSCSWAKPAKTHTFEFCENGAKATLWEVTDKKTGPDFFAQHPLTELREWSDHQLEEHGRLTHPLKYDAATDRYISVPWNEAFSAIGAELNSLDPHAVVMYTSGRASLEASYMYQLFGRMYGTSNFPDSSNMCHESTSVALPQVIGVPVGTVTLDDFAHTDCVFLFGHNTSTNAPRMLHPLQECARRGVPIISVNPLRERGLERFVNPQSPVQMVFGGTRISSQYLQITAGGDIAAITGICKAIVEADDQALASGRPRLIDVEFIEQHCSSFAVFAQSCRAHDWTALECASGLDRKAMIDAANVYMASKAVIVGYGMGVTQHRHGVETVKMMVNLALLRGNIGKPGAGMMPIRGHSNVQGQRTVGISEKAKLVPLGKLKELYGFEPPRWDGLTTVDACEGILQGRVRAFFGLGGNFLRAIPERNLMEQAWPRMRLIVSVATKLNRTHLFPGELSYLLPCLGRTEIDRQTTGEQALSMEDSTACIHGSRGQREPVSEHILSEPKIVAELAKATLKPNPLIDWDAWTGNYTLVRDAIERTYPEMFKDFNKRMFTPGGFPRPLAARERKWKTPNGKANFTVPNSLTGQPTDAEDVYRLITLRADGQFNTTIYTEDDRFRGVYESRHVVLMNRTDIAELGLKAGDQVTLSSASDDGIDRQLAALQIVPYDVPKGCLVGYYPECNVLIPLSHYARESKVPASKSVPVRLRKSTAAEIQAA